MEQELQSRLEKLTDRILDAREKVSRLHEKPEIDRKVAEVNVCFEALDAVRDAYREILDGASDEERDQIERRQGRRVTELRQFASWLPSRTAGEAVPLATSTQWLPAASALTGSEPNRKVNNSSRPRDPGRFKPQATGPTVGGEIDAWCGPCKQMRTHRIFAMVNGEPKQVICGICDGRHNYRTTPGRKPKADDTGLKKHAPMIGTKPTAKQLEKERAAEARAAMFREIDAAEDVRQFSKRSRYKAGEIIEHEVHGRGKIEHVVRGSLLVRFRSGLKPLDLF